MSSWKVSPLRIIRCQYGDIYYKSIPLVSGDTHINRIILVNVMAESLVAMNLHAGAAEIIFAPKMIYNKTRNERSICSSKNHKKHLVLKSNIE